MNDINIRSLQHYLYCPHRWGLMEVDRAWAENYFVARGNLVHERAHSVESYTGRGKRVHTSVKVWHDGLGMYGVIDCLEESGGEYNIVEYKPTAPPNGSCRHDDLMQIFAQKLCVDNVFSCDCKAFIYYADTKKRVLLPMDGVWQQCYSELLTVLEQMRKLRDIGSIPPITKGQNCSGCSMKDICIPAVHKKKSNVTASIREFAGGEE